MLLPATQSPEAAKIGAIMRRRLASHFDYAENAKIGVQTFFRQSAGRLGRGHIGDPHHQLSARVGLSGGVIFLQEQRIAHPIVRSVNRRTSWVLAPESVASKNCGQDLTLCSMGPRAGAAASSERCSVAK